MPKAKPKRRSPILSRRRQSTRRYRFNATEETPKTMVRKPNPKTKRPSRPGRKSARPDNLHPDSGSRKSVLKVRLEASLIPALERLAKQHGTILAQEVDNAIVGYLLGANQDEIRQMNTCLDRLNETIDRNNLALEVLGAIAKAHVPSPRRQRSGQRRERSTPVIKNRRHGGMR